MSDVENMPLSITTQTKEIFISPEFYTTDIQKFSNVDTVKNSNPFDAALFELKKDDNKDKYIRSKNFTQSWDHLQDEDREIIITILEKYCAAEYAGFILYKELSYQLKNSNSLLSDAFSFMARDEARHASFLNKALLDFHLKPNLNFLKKENRKYSNLPFSWFIYSTYLSEKISSVYYITVFNHLKAHPKYSIYPLFEYYQSWSEDESRHGDFLGAIIKTQPQFSNGFKARWTCKLYLVLIFSMTYFSHRKNDTIFHWLGLDPREYSVSTIKQVNQSIGKSLPLVLNLENSQFFEKLDSCLVHLSVGDDIKDPAQNSILKLLQKTLHYLAVLFMFPSLFLIHTTNREQKRNTKP